MATFALTLENFAVVDGQVVLTLIHNGARITQKFADKQAMIDWSRRGDKLDLDDLVRHAVRKARESDPTLSNPANFIGKTLIVTIDSEVT